MLARPAGRATYHRALRSGKLIPQNEKTLRRSEGSVEPSHELWRAGELIPQNERELRRSEGSGMLIGGPLGEESNAGSTNSELWGAEHSFLGMSGHSDAPKGAAYS